MTVMLYFFCKNYFQVHGKHRIMAICPFWHHSGTSWGKKWKRRIWHYVYTAYVRLACNLWCVALSAKGQFGQFRPVQHKWLQVIFNVHYGVVIAWPHVGTLMGTVPNCYKTIFVMPYIYSKMRFFLFQQHSKSWGGWTTIAYSETLMEHCHFETSFFPKPTSFGQILVYVKICPFIL